MKCLARIVVCAAAIVVGVFGLSVFAGDWLGEETNVFGAARWIFSESRRTDAIQYRREAVSRNHALKRSVIADLFAGRLTMDEAAARFREANEQIEADDSSLVAEYRRPATEAALYFQVLAWVRAGADSVPPETAGPVVRACEKQYQDRFGATPPSLPVPIHLGPSAP